MDPLSWTIWAAFLLPLGAAIVIAVLTLGNRQASAGLSIGAITLSFILTAFYSLMKGLNKAGAVESELTWLSVNGSAPGDALNVGMGILLDPLSLMMMLVVTGVGMLIHIYSRGYMKDDASYSRYFACLSLFTFSMMGIVLATNFVQMFIFWELVGVSSYLLIGFWFGRPAAADAGKKAFITNRIGDFGFLLGILMVWGAFGEVSFSVVADDIAHGGNKLEGMVACGCLSMATLAGLLIFCGALGKSAQFPLHVWLPDAMEGPTPVSALIHAATMVAAGVYMLCRTIFIFNEAALLVIAFVGGFTALLAALMAVQQDDIKRILAYSTLSQLGYMVMAVGLNGHGEGATAAMYHLTTHAAFKALLFLGAGSVICAVHHEQDIWKMGGLRDRMPATYATFCIGTLALMGLPPFSGFYSKDAILSSAAPWIGGHGNIILFIVALAVAFLTAFYMTRLVYVAFRGAARTDHARHAKESPGVMTKPLWVLAFPAVLAGWFGLDAIFAGHFGAHTHYDHWYSYIVGPVEHAPFVAAMGTALAVLGWYVASLLYRNVETDPLPGRLGSFGFVTTLMRRRFYFDEIYKYTVVAIHDAFASVADWVDRWIIAGLLVRGSHGTTELVGRIARMLQTGNLQTYAAFSIFGAAVLVIVFLIA